MKVPDQLPGYENSSIPAEHTIRGFYGTTLLLDQHEPTAEVLKSLFGFSEAENDANKWHYTTDANIGGSVIIEEGESKPSANGRGIIHHVAFRAEDDDELELLREKVLEMGLSPSQVIDRHWFHSVYFRSPGGVLFEIATDGPGYDVDEDPDKLGQKLILPPWLESKREMIEKRLPEIRGVGSKDLPCQCFSGPECISRGGEIACERRAKCVRGVIFRRLAERHRGVLTQFL